MCSPSCKQRNNNGQSLDLTAFLDNDLVIGKDEDAEEVSVDDESSISALKQLVLAQFGLKCSVHEMKVYDLENETVRLMNAMKVSCFTKAGIDSFLVTLPRAEQPQQPNGKFRCCR